MHRIETTLNRKELIMRMITLRCSEDQHARIVLLAQESNCSINDYLLNRLLAVPMRPATESIRGARPRIGPTKDFVPRKILPLKNV